MEKVVTTDKAGLDKGKNPLGRTGGGGESD